MVNARAPSVDTTAEIIDMLVKRDGSSCFWCSSKVVDGEKMTVIHRVPPKAEEPVGGDGLALVCAPCDSTQNRNIRFPVGLLDAASEVSDMPFSEIVRQAVSQYVCNLREAPVGGFQDALENMGRSIKSFETINANIVAYQESFALLKMELENWDEAKVKSIKEIHGGERP
jgi:hypothetical protein